jgi:undecaprenyl-diphosphatase
VTFEIDQQLLLLIGKWGRSDPAALAFFHAMTRLGDASVRMTLAALTAIYLAIAGAHRRAFFLIITVPSGWLVSTLLKLVLARPRPDLVAPLDTVSTYSMPSGHAWNSVVVFIGIALALAPVCPPCWRSVAMAGAGILAFAIGLSRIVLGVHWPSDVLAGWIGGGAWLTLCYRLLLSDGGRLASGQIPR